MAVLITYASTLFLGNRTVYPNLTVRNGSDVADPNYWTTGTGSVQLTFTNGNQAPNQHLQTFHTSWSNPRNISISYQTFPAKQTCDFPGDVVVFDATEVGVYQDCLIDLYAYDFDIASTMDNATTLNGVYSNRLVALPHQQSEKVLLYNKVYLGTHGYVDVPKTLVEFTDMIVDIQTNERGAENYNLGGISIALLDPQEVVALVSEWTTGVGI